ncbi:hypothetical protein PVK06_023348 [Gossypium arboreum]|uniref:Uncharacterized protein n=1 Tax=Gossypium arboreum TaxID=29729 RepID=A0ABR0PB43_GOSAR|nr:hypothetical protein PVK06_023348 [Gossypium arboreum]
MQNGPLRLVLTGSRGLSSYLQQKPNKSVYLVLLLSRRSRQSQGQTLNGLGALGVGETPSTTDEREATWVYRGSTKENLAISVQGNNHQAEGTLMEARGVRGDQVYGARVDRNPRVF